jgi:hypothetical protein
VACPKVEEFDRRLLKSLAGRKQTRAKSRTCVAVEIILGGADTEDEEVEMDPEEPDIES